MAAGPPPQRHGTGAAAIREAGRAVDPHVLGHVDGTHSQASKGDAHTWGSPRDGPSRAMAMALTLAPTMGRPSDVAAPLGGSLL